MCAGALVRVKASDGVVVGLVTVVVKSGDRLPEEKLETVPEPTLQVGQEMVAMPLAVLTTMAPEPVAESRPVLLRVTEPPRATLPPPLRPVPAVTESEGFCSMALVTPAVAMEMVPVVVMGPPVRPAPVSTSVSVPELPADGVVNSRVTLLPTTPVAVRTWLAVGAVAGSCNVRAPAVDCAARVTVPEVSPARATEPRVVPATPRVGVALKDGSVVAP